MGRVREAWNILTFPELNPEEIFRPWNKADIGELSSLEIWAAAGFQGDLEKIERNYLDTIELNDGFLDFVQAVRSKYKLAIISNDSSRWSRYLRQKFNINQFGIKRRIRKDRQSFSWKAAKRSFGSIMKVKA